MAQPTPIQNQRLFIVVIHSDGNDAASFSVHTTSDLRIAATFKALYGHTIDQATEEELQIFAKEVKELQEEKWLRFEGDPPLQWIDSGVVLVDEMQPGYREKVKANLHKLEAIIKADE